MIDLSYSFLRASAVAATLALLASGCSGGGGAGSHANAIPQTQSGSRAAGVAAIRGAAARTSDGETLGARDPHRKSTTDYTSPSNVTTAEPPVARPSETPCVVQLFSNLQFTNFTAPQFQYAPPANCAGPWAKVVLEGDFSVNAGRQYDRSGSIWIAGTNVYFGTTAEPSANLGPSWHIERDVTDLSAILKAPSTGEVVLGNLVNGTYTGIITASAKLEFYPVSARYQAADAPDDVYPLSGGPLGDNQYLSSPQQPLTATYTLPPNVRAAYLDVYLQSQGGDEFWYTCFPNDLAQKLNNCGSTAFREGDVAIDGRPAGVVPVYPWIYTGGIDPYLWRPIPGIETLDFKPYRVNLTPFAGVLSDGNPHTVTVNVFNNGNYFAANGALLVYLDHGASHVTGGIISDATTLNPNPMVSENVVFDSQGTGTGPISVVSTHAVSIDGYADTSAGRIETQIDQSIHFSNTQQITANTAGTLFDQSIKQDTTVTSNTTTISGPGQRVTDRAQRDWPLNVTYDFSVNPDGSATQFASVEQGKHERFAGHTTGGGQPFRSSLDETDSASDTLTFFAAGGYAPSGGKSEQTYRADNSEGYCYDKDVASVNYVVTRQSGGFCGI